MYSYLFGIYYYINDLEKIIDDIEKDRKKMKYIGEPMATTFAQDLKLRLKLPNLKLN